LYEHKVHKKANKSYKHAVSNTFYYVLVIVVMWSLSVKDSNIHSYICAIYFLKQLLKL